MDCSGMAQEVSRHINANLFKYFPHLDGVETEIRLISEQHRASSSLYKFEVVNHQVSYKLFAKGIALAKDSGHDKNTRIDSRPRVSPGPTEPGEKTRLEYNALKAIYEYFERLGDPGFGAIRVLDYIQNPQTIIMVENSDPTLRTLFAKTNRLNYLRGKSPDLRRIFFNTGAWLKAYSTIPKVDDVITRLPHREGFNESIINLTGFLSRISGDAPFFQRVEKTVIPAANEIMPANLPLGLGHGDYAMRNLLVGENDRITAFDTRAKWKVPIYEDIAYFLVQLETNGLQVLTQGFAFRAQTIATYQREFLAGYFGETHVPIELIRLFKIQLLLDSWSSKLSTYNQHQAGIKKVYRQLYLSLLNRRYKIIMGRILNEIAVRPS